MKAIAVKLSKRISKGSLLIFIILLFMMPANTSAQQNNWKVRIASIIIDSNNINAYKTALVEHVKTALAVEPGVLRLDAVYDKDHPTHITVFEIYASDSAYQAHIKTTHFLKYKNTVKDMVKSLTLTDVEPIYIAPGKLK